MGNCGSRICQSDESKVTANPDVAGIGVVVAFALSAVFALLAMLYGYFTDSFPENTLTEFDFLYLVVPLRRQAVAAIHVRRSSAKAQCGEKIDDYAARAKRLRALERFILTLSDQQLVTGLAILIAGYMETCSLPLYYFNIVASLAWFSSATHLATLGALQDYLIHNPVVRNWRVVAMIMVLGLLISAQPPSWSNRDGSIPIFCVYEDLEMVVDPTNLLTLITTIGFLFVIYLKRIVRLYSFDLDWTFSDIVIEALTKLVTRKDYQEPSRVTVAKQGASTGKPKASISSSIRKERERIRHARFKSAMENRTGKHHQLKVYINTILFVADEQSYAFASQIMILIFDLVYGFTSTIVVRNEIPYDGIEGNQNEMGFGQLVPLILLLLPALAVGEIYFANHDDPAQVTSSASDKPHSRNRPSETKRSATSPSQTSVSSSHSASSGTEQQAHNRPTSSKDQHHPRNYPKISTDSQTQPTRLEDLLRFISPGDRKDTGWALRQSHSYQLSEFPFSNPGRKDAQNTSGDESSNMDPNQNSHESARATSTASSSSIKTETTDAPQQDGPEHTLSSSKIQQDPEKTTSKHMCTNIHHRRIFICVFAFQCTFQLSFALALGGAFGQKGYKMAAVFLLIVLTGAVVSVVDGTKQRLLQIRAAKRESNKGE
ncbi:MAG: hypothetical protein Q9168_005219 [Polycauliona sp. 1 TL-2023]